MFDGNVVPRLKERRHCEAFSGLSDSPGAMLVKVIDEQDVTIHFVNLRVEQPTAIG
jgi:hypothetical protein